MWNTALYLMMKEEIVWFVRRGTSFLDVQCSSVSGEAHACQQGEELFSYFHSFSAKFGGCLLHMTKIILLCVISFLINSIMYQTSILHCYLIYEHLFCIFMQKLKCGFFLKVKIKFYCKLILSAFK